MNSIARDENQIARPDPRGFLANSEPTLTFQDQHELIVIWLDVDDVAAVFENVDVTRDMLSVT